MTIYNQDLDEQYTYSPARDTLRTEIRYLEDNGDIVFLGVNVLVSDNLLGTYDTLQEAINEMAMITDWRPEIYCMSGRNPMWEDWTMVCEIMKGE